MSKPYKTELLGVILVSLLVAACSGEYKGQTRGISYLVNPFNNATGVEPAIVVKVAFSRDIFAASVNSNSLSLNSGTGSVAGAVAYDGRYKTVSFTPAGGLALSTTYTANLSSTVSDLNGYSIAGYSWSFTTREGGWGTAQLLESDNTGAAQYPHIAVDGSGNAMAVWHHSDGTRNNIWASYYNTGGTWSTPEKLEFDDYSDALYPRVAFDNSGNAIAVWYQTETSALYSNIWSNHYTAGTGWGTAQKIDTEDAGAALNPQIGFDGTGNAIAVWYQLDGTRDNIWSNRYASGSWGTAEKIETDDFSNAQNPKIALDGSGNAIAVWQQTETSSTFINIWTNRYTAGAWGTAAKIDSEDLGDAQFPEIAFDSSGNAITVWTQLDGTYSNIWVNHYTSGASWGTAQLIETDSTGTALGPKVSVDSSGNAIAVWYQTDGTRNNIWANRYTASGSWGTAQLIETDNAGDAFYPDLAMDSNGNAIAVWSQSDGTRENIWANRYSSSTGWGTAELIETENLGFAQYPEIAVGGNNKAFTVWYQSDGTRNNIWVNDYY